MFATTGVLIAAVLATALVAEGADATAHNVHLGAVLAAVGWVLYFAARGHRS